VKRNTSKKEQKEMRNPAANEMIAKNNARIHFSQDTKCFQPIRRIEVRVPFSQSQYSEEKPIRNDLRVMTSTDISFSQSEKDVNIGQSTNATSLRRTNSEAQEEVYPKMRAVSPLGEHLEKHCSSWKA